MKIFQVGFVLGLTLVGSGAQAWDPYVNPSVLDDPMDPRNIRERIEKEYQQSRLEQRLRRLEKRQQEAEEEAREYRKRQEAEKEGKWEPCLSDACLRLERQRFNNGR